MELALEGVARYYLVEVRRVSILVIMELALEEVSKDGKEIYYRGFNPCYYGIGFRSYTFDFVEMTGTGFNPCYYGIGFRRLLNNSRTSGDYSFNPCYYGIGFRR